MMMMVDRKYIKKPLRSSRQTSIRPWSAAYITAFFPAYKRFLKSRVWISLWQRRSLSTWFSWSMLMPGAAISCSTTSRWPYLAIMCIRIGIECPTSTISQYISQFHQPTCCWKWGREPVYVYQYIRQEDGAPHHAAHMSAVHPPDTVLFTFVRGLSRRAAITLVWPLKFVIIFFMAIIIITYDKQEQDLMTFACSNNKRGGGGHQACPLLHKIHSHITLGKF